MKQTPNPTATPRPSSAASSPRRGSRSAAKAGRWSAQRSCRRTQWWPSLLCTAHASQPQSRSCASGNASDRLGSATSPACSRRWSPDRSARCRQNGGRCRGWSQSPCRRWSRAVGRQRPKTEGPLVAGKLSSLIFYNSYKMQVLQYAHTCTVHDFNINITVFYFILFYLKNRCSEVLYGWVACKM